jgi:hypothetical protein
MSLPNDTHNPATSPTPPDINDAEDSGARGERDKRRGAGEGGEGPRAGGRQQYGRRPHEFSTRTRGRRLHWSLLIPPLVLLVLAVSKTGRREAYRCPVLAHLTPPVLVGIIPAGSTMGAACGFNTAPFLFPFHTPLIGGFSTSNEKDDGAAYNPHAAPHLTSFSLDYAHSSVIEKGQCAMHTPPPFPFNSPLLGVFFFLC